MVSSSLAFHKFSSLTFEDVSVMVPAVKNILDWTYLSNLILVRGLEDTVASDVVSLASDVFTHLTK